MGYLDEHFDLFRGWATGQGGAGIDEATRGLRDALAPYQLLGWHCTRLTDAECDDILRAGMRLPDAALLTSRIETLVKAGDFTPDHGQQLTSKNDAAKANRAGRVWFCFFPPRDAGQRGIERFLSPLGWRGTVRPARAQFSNVASPCLDWRTADRRGSRAARVAEAARIPRARLLLPVRCKSRHSPAAARCLRGLHRWSSAREERQPGDFHTQSGLRAAHRALRVEPTNPDFLASDAGRASSQAMFDQSRRDSEQFSPLRHIAGGLYSPPFSKVSGESNWIC